MDEELRVTYEVLCGVSYWLKPKFAEGDDVMEAVRFQLRRIESVLGMTDKVALDREPSEPKYLADLRAKIKSA